MPPPVKSWFDWDGRPAVRLEDGRFFAITSLSDGAWEELPRVSVEDVIETAGVLSKSAFNGRFPDANPLTIPDRPDSATARA